MLSTLYTSSCLIPQLYKVGTIITLILQDHTSSRLCSQSLNQGLPADALRIRFKLPCLELSSYQAHPYHSNLILCPFSLLSSPCYPRIYFNSETSARGCQSLSCLSISAFASACKALLPAPLQGWIHVTLQISIMCNFRLALQSTPSSPKLLCIMSPCSFSS